MTKNTLIQKHFQKSHLLKMSNPTYQKTVDALFNWLISADRTENDLTAQLLNKNQTKACIHTKQDIFVAGIEEVEHLLKKYPEISFQKKVLDGANIKKSGEIAVISGDNRTILSLERTILNILQRMSGIATQTQKLVNIIASTKKLSTHNQQSAISNPQSVTYIAATRKTPWMQLDKKAVAIGGGLTHRLDLSDGILIKDNHLQILKNQYKLQSEAQAVTRALEMTLEFASNNLTIRRFAETSPLGGEQLSNACIEIEVNTKEAAYAAIKTFCESSFQWTPENSLAIMLDNWNITDAQNFINEIHLQDGRLQQSGSHDSWKVDSPEIIFEASGNINESNLKDWAQTGVDIISSGALTHSVKAPDLSLSILSD